MLYLPINKDWIVSPIARRIYFICALLAIALFGTLFSAIAALIASGTRSFADVPAAMFDVKALVLPEVLGTAVLSVAMWYFWFSFDRASWVRKALWLPPLYTFYPQ
jgi:hypothetical protein